MKNDKRRELASKVATLKEKYSEKHGKVVKMLELYKLPKDFSKVLLERRIYKEMLELDELRKVYLQELNKLNKLIGSKFLEGIVD